MSLYAQYVKEREGAVTVETSEGFYSYKVDGDYIFIVDLYVVPEYRAKKVGSKFGREIEDITRELGKSTILCSASLESLNSSDAIAFIIMNGYEIINYTDTQVFFKKEIK